MSSITTRSGKGSPLTNSEVDANFTNLNTDKLENITSESIKSLSDVYSSMSPSDGQALVFDSTNGWQAENVTTDTSALMPKSGGTFTGDVTFNSSAILGSALTIGTTNLTYNQSGSQNFQVISNKDIDMKVSNQDRITLRTSSFGGQVELYNAGSKKFETSSSGVNVIGNITVSGTVDGRDIAAMGTKLDGIETNATADQTKADIDALNINSDLLDGQHGSYYTGYTDTAISNLVDSSPSTLNTLNELAAALGDDANFSATVTTSLGTKLPKSGGTMTGNINLNTQSLTFSDSSNQYSISSASSAALKIQAGAASGQQIDVLSNTIRLQNQAGTKTGLQSTPEGATTLYHNNAAKIATSSSGVTVTGTLAATALTGDGSGLTNLPAQSDNTKMPLAGGTFTGDVILQGSNANIEFDVSNDAMEVKDNARIIVGNGDDMMLYHNGTNYIDLYGNTYIRNTKANSYTFLEADNGSGSPTPYVTLNGVTGAVQLSHYGSQKLATSSSGVTVTGNIANSSGDMLIDVAGDLKLDAGGATIFFQDDGATWGYIENQTTDGAFDIKSSTNNYDMRFRGTDNGSTVTALTLDMANAGTAIFNDDIKLSDSKRVRLGNGGDLQLLHDGGGTSHISNYTGHLYITNYSDDADIKIQTDNGQGNVTDYILADGGDGSVHLMHYGSTKLQTINTGVSVSGSITVSGTVDGRDVAADGTKLDGIAAGANVGIASLAADSSPQLGGVLDVNGQAIDFGDDEYLRFGNNNEHRIYHKGTGSVLRIEAPSGHSIEVRGGPSSNSFFSVLDANGTNIIKATMNGSSSGVTLHHGGGTKLATSSSGITVTGTLAATAVTGDGSGLTNLPSSFPASGGTFTGDVTFTGANYDTLFFDASANDLIFKGAFLDLTWDANDSYLSGESNVRFRLGDSNNLQLYHGGTYDNYNYIKNTSPLRIDGDNVTFRRTNNHILYDMSPTAHTFKISNADKFVVDANGADLQGDFQFNGDSSNLLWDSSANKLKFDASTSLSMGTNGEFEIVQFSTQAQIGMSGGQVTFKGGDTFTLNDGAGNRNRIVSTSGTSGTVSLYYGASNKKLETSSSGVTVTGTLAATSLTGNGDNITVSSSALSGTSPSVNVGAKDTYTLTTSGNTTFSFTGAPSSGNVGTFSLLLTAGGTHTITWPSSVDWAGGSAPDAPASGEKNIYTFMTVDGGSNYYGFLAGAAFA